MLYLRHGRGLRSACKSAASWGWGHHATVKGGKGEAQAGSRTFISSLPMGTCRHICPCPGETCKHKGSVDTCARSSSISGTLITRDSICAWRPEAGGPMASQTERHKNGVTLHPNVAFGTTGHFPGTQKDSLGNWEPKLFMEETGACF